MPDLPFAKARGLPTVLANWKHQGAIEPLLTLDRTLVGRDADWAEIPGRLPECLVQALAKREIDALYTHQADAIRSALTDRHTVIATPTSSGKSLCFHLPVLTRLLEDPSATALYLYPTKALSRDQEHSLHSLVADAGLSVAATVFDGDTPADARKVARDRARIVLSNPDMLHAGILPNHARWAQLFQGLRYVVLDELHTYRGVFGSHMAHVIARLRRVAAFHGSHPVFICATATIGNPREHAARLLGLAPEDIHLVDKSGAPYSPRRLLVVNPPIVNAELGIRRSSLKQAVAVTADLIRARVPTILFGPSRNSVETMLKYLRQQAGDVAGADAIMGYRGGYLPATRRKIEQDLREGKLLAVVATNALELGIDIGDLDAVVLAGYPGSVAATWQRFGRAGRRGNDSLLVLVCSSEGLDQYIARDPEYLLTTRSEEARIDPSNIEILVQHLKCAAFESPFTVSPAGDKPAHPDAAEGEAYAGLDPTSTRDALEYLAGHGLIHEADGRFFWSGEAFPANQVSLRNVGWDNFVIIDVGTGLTLAELDWRATHTMLHEQAIYQHDAEQYQVERLDYDNHKAFVRKVEPDYFTTALTYRTVTVIEPESTGLLGRAKLGMGEVKVLEKVTGYKKIKFFTHENAGYGDVHLPVMEMHTTSFWLTLPESLVAELNLPRAEVIAGLRGLGQALETTATLALMCDPRDIKRTLGDGSGDGTAPGRDPFTGRVGGFDPTIFLFDAAAGGVGLAPRIYGRALELVERAALLIRGCNCASGCPACVGPEESEGNVRAAALRIAKLLLGN
jgi:DEAD/DEAH box helicase domain-containing protein